MLFSEIFLFSKKTPLFENVGDHKDNNMNMQMYYSPDVVSFPYIKQVPPPPHHTLLQKELYTLLMICTDKNVSVW